MATPSEVKAGLDDISKVIRAERNALKQATARVSAAVANLNAIPAQFSAVIAEIDGYAPTGAREGLAQSEKAALAAEFTALKVKANTAKSGMDAIDFSS